MQPVNVNDLKSKAFRLNEMLGQIMINDFGDNDMVRLIIVNSALDVALEYAGNLNN